MKITNGKILIFFGVVHPLLGISPLAFGKQFIEFSETYFFKISEGLWEFPLLNGKMNYENFAAFWFFYFGILLIPLGILVNYVEEQGKKIPISFMYSYIAVVVLGIYMIPFSGMTMFMLPHAIYMIVSRKKHVRGEAKQRMKAA